MEQKQKIIPIEETDPIIAELIKDVCNKRYDRFNCKKIIFEKNNVILIPYNNFDTVGPYEKCPCGSGKKRRFCSCMDLFKD